MRTKFFTSEDWAAIPPPERSTGKPAGYLNSPGLDHATKNALGFEVGGKSSCLKAMKVWEAAASPDWAARRDAFVEALWK